MPITRLLATQNVSLTGAATSGVAVIAPATLDMRVGAMTATYFDTGGSATTWSMLSSATDAVGKTMPSYDKDLEYMANPGQTLFFAKSENTGTLNIAYYAT